MWFAAVYGYDSVVKVLIKKGRRLLENLNPNHNARAMCRYGLQINLEHRRSLCSSQLWGIRVQVLSSAWKASSQVKTRVSTEHH